MISFSLIAMAFGAQSAQISTGIWIGHADDKTSFEWRNRFLIEQKSGDWKTGAIFRHQIWFDESPAQEWSFEPWVIRWKKTVGPYRISLGNLQLRWGQLDALSTLDILCGKELRYGPLTPPQLLRRPSPALKISRQIDAFDVQAIWMPFSSRDTINPVAHQWGVLSTAQLNGLFSNAETWTGDALTGELMGDLVRAIGQQFDPSQNRLIDVNAFKDSSVSLGDIGLRIGLEFSSFSVHASGGHFKDRRPKPSLNPDLMTFLVEERLPDSNELTELTEALHEAFVIEEPRYWMLGLDFNTLLGPFGIRGEFSHRSKQALQLYMLQTETVPWYGGGLAIDWTDGGANILSGEVSWNKYMTNTTDSWLEKPETYRVAMAYMGTAMQQRLSFGLRALAELPVKEWALTPRVSWKLQDGLDILVEGILIESNASATDNPFAFEGGLLGAWKDNDTINITLNWAK